MGRPADMTAVSGTCGFWDLVADSTMHRKAPTRKKCPFQDQRGPGLNYYITGRISVDRQMGQYCLTGLYSSATGEHI